MNDKTDLQIMQEMCDRNSQGIMMSNTVVEAKSHPAGGLVSMGISRELLQKYVLEPQKYFVGIYFVDIEEFNEIKNS